jgi:hypothetical protein
MTQIPEIPGANKEGLVVWSHSNEHQTEYGKHKKSRNELMKSICSIAVGKEADAC